MKHLKKLSRNELKFLKGGVGLEPTDLNLDDSPDACPRYSGCRSGRAKRLNNHYTCC